MIMVPASVPAPPDVLAAVNAAVARGVPLNLDVRWFPTVPSTMDVAAELAEAGAREGVVIVADEQTDGRGRRGRQWSSPAGAGLYVTFVLRPPRDAVPAALLSLLTLTAGVSVREAVACATGFTPELKWPNDLVVGERKLAGILAEGIGIGTATQVVLIGIGINLLDAAHPGAIAGRATSLESELGRHPEPAVLLEEVLVRVSRGYDALRRGNVDDILRAWRSAAPSAMGRTVEWPTPDGMHRGTTAGIDNAGALLVETARGIERVLAGEVTWT
jgi:BirA family biotin operon repressor/biotin-[acetyl-CoA-carboxylase] ligase